MLGDAGLTSLAKQVRRAGIKRISGAIVGDESLFDRRRGGPDSGYRYDYDLSGSLGALVWGHGSSASGNPAQTTITRFGARLKAAGVRYGRAPRVGVLPSGSSTGGTRGDVKPIAITRSRPIRDLIRAINVPSENFYAEMMTKVLGARFGKSGSTKSGLEVVSTAIAPFSIAPKLKDGSGLSRSNQASAYTVTALLAGMHVSEVADEYRASLPIAGLSGTLASRMRGTAAAGRCRAKTGTLNGVSALSGYCLTTGRRSIAFSFIENRICSGCAKAVEDRMVATLARLD
jgi:D-alanyl-D-alanine carboxypeptidase/D-alanyl-D-alanine-endopeptidase (penicillin-binding protein 4)